MKVLLIEPDRVLAKNYLQALQLAGHKVQVCATAQAGLFSADDVRPEVVLLELQLVAHSGVEFIHEFRSYQDWQEIPVIILSHVPPTEFGLNWKTLQRQLGLRHYLYKPQTSLKDVVAAVEQFAAV